MKQSASRLIGPLAAAALVLYGVPALSARPPVQVSGTVTSIEGRQIAIDGTRYDVQLQGGALQQLAQVHVGDKVDLVLSGPVGASSTQVSAIREHNAR
jgi:hypothetical protein